MALPTDLNPHFLASSGGYQIQRSLRFNSADSAYLNRTPASAGNRKTWTYSVWVKLGPYTTSCELLMAGPTPYDSNNRFIFQLENNFGDGRITVYNNNATTVTIYKIATQLFRDPSAWYHFVIYADTPNSVIKLYANGVEQWSQSITANSDLQVNATNPHSIGAYHNATSPFSGYMADINFIDGQALTPSSFGETNADTGVWQPKAYTGTYGTNGFYLKFADNSGTTSTTLGKDSSGNGNNWTPNNFSVTAGAGNDSLVDTPTPYGTDTGAGGEVRGNYATFNPTAVSGMGLATLANGNLDASGTSSSYVGAVSTIAMSSGKWYWETTILALGQTNGAGIVASTSLASAVGGTYGYATVSDCWFRASNGVVYSNSAAAVSSLSTFTTNDVVNIAVDFDAGKLWFGKNGTWDSSGNPATGSNATITFTPGGKSFYAMVQAYTNSGSWSSALNAGQRPFAYTAPSGYKALCTQNLPTPTIGATSTTQAGKYFNPVLYTGSGATQTITGVGFQPDFSWFKSRSNATNHVVYDVVRGGVKQLYPSAIDAEFTSGDGFLAFASDGFTLDSTGGGGNANVLNRTYVAWNWKAGGSVSANNNTDGTITSTVSANTTSGFSVVTFTTTSNTGTATVGHGLGAAPSMIIMKNRERTYNWEIYHVSVTASGGRLIFTTSAKLTDANPWNQNNQAPTSTIFGFDQAWNGFSGDDIVAYCFAPVAGYSAFGSYTGNGSTDGVFIYTGFRPRYIMIKRTNTTGNWIIYDAARNPANLANNYLYANASDAAVTDTPGVDLLSNGFKNRNDYGDANFNGSTYVYAAFAEFPFKYSLAR